MNLIFAEMINCTYGVSIDISAALQHGWKLGRTVCNTTGFLLTFSGKFLRNNCHLKVISESNLTVMFCQVSRFYI